METQTKTRHSGKEVYILLPLLFLFTILASANTAIVILLGGQQRIATMRYQLDLADEGTLCKSPVLTNCVSGVALWLTGKGQEYTLIEIHIPYPTSGTRVFGSYDLYGPPKGKPYGERVYWVVLVKRDAHGQQIIRVLATQAIQGQEKPKL